MSDTGLWLRVAGALVLASLPPILLLLAALLLSESLLREADPMVVGATVIGGTLIWAAILGLVYARALADDVRAMLRAAEHGASERGPELGTAYQQLTSALEERNRQVATLALETRRVPIDDEPRRVVAALVEAVRSVMHDHTWRAAVLSSPDLSLLPAGAYAPTDGEPSVDPLGELDRWASASMSETGVVRADGPWGAFVVVDIGGGDGLRAVLLAPWEGRPELSAADTAILSLVGQHAATALEHSMLYARVRSQAEEISRLARIQSDFLRGVTHDLQTPLTSIAALATELRADASVPERGQADLESIAHQAERLRRMVAQLLVASRLEAGALTPQTEIFAVPPIVERTWQALRAERPFEMEVSGPAALAVADPDRFEQVLWALLDNAVKYSPAGSAVSVTVATKDDQLAVTVEDHGIGMDEAERARAFDQFHRAPAARKLAPDGSGVGLYAARGLVEAMGGSVSVESALGQGTSITVRLPAELSGAAD